MNTITELNREEALACVGRVKDAIEIAWGDLVRLYQFQGWKPLGYVDWDELCQEEFHGARIALPRQERQEVVHQLRDAGMSTRAIASATGAARNTVLSDLQQVAQNEPLGGDAPSTGKDSTAESGEPAKVVGLNGKRYDAKKPKRKPDEFTEKEAKLHLTRNRNGAICRIVFLSQELDQGVHGVTVEQVVREFEADIPEWDWTSSDLRKAADTLLVLADRWVKR